MTASSKKPRNGRERAKTRLDALTKAARVELRARLFESLLAYTQAKYGTDIPESAIHDPTVQQLAVGILTSELAGKRIQVRLDQARKASPATRDAVLTASLDESRVLPQEARGKLKRGARTARPFVSFAPVPAPETVAGRSLAASRKAGTSGPIAKDAGKALAAASSSARREKSARLAAEVAAGWRAERAAGTPENRIGSKLRRRFKGRCGRSVIYENRPET